MGQDVLDVGLGALAFSRKVTLGLLEKIPDDKLTYQPMAGANHALWIMGHVAHTDELFLSSVGNRPVRKFDAWKELFFMGSVPKPGLADYPPIAELRDYVCTSREALIDWFKSMGEAELQEPLAEDMQSFAPTRAVLMCTIACHETLHAGQLTVVRKGLGIGPVFG